MKKRCPSCHGIFHAHRERCPAHGALEPVSLVTLGEREDGASADPQQLASVLRQAASLADDARAALSPLRVYVAPAGPLSIEGIDAEREPHALDDALYSPHDAGALSEQQRRAYRLAAFAHALLAGAPAFFAKTPKAVLVRKRLERAPSLAEQRPDLPAAVIDAVKRALDRDPSLDEGALLAAVRAVSDAPTRARSAAAPVPTPIALAPMAAAPSALSPPPARARPPVAALALLGVAITLAIGAGALVLSSKSAPSRASPMQAHEAMHSEEVVAPSPVATGQSAPLAAATSAATAPPVVATRPAGVTATGALRGDDESPSRARPAASGRRSGGAQRRPVALRAGAPGAIAPRPTTIGPAPVVAARAPSANGSDDQAAPMVDAQQRAAPSAQPAAPAAEPAAPPAQPAAGERRPRARRARTPSTVEPTPPRLADAIVAPAATAGLPPESAPPESALRGAANTAPTPSGTTTVGTLAADNTAGPRVAQAPAAQRAPDSRAPWALGIIAALAAISGALALALRARTATSGAGEPSVGAPRELLATRASVIDSMHATVSATIPASQSGAVDALARTELGASGRGSQPSTLKTHTDFQPFAIGAYQCVEPLGEGAMGIVYKARDERTGQLCAVKVLVPDLAARPDAARQFRREAELAASVKHPNTVGVRDFGELDGGMLYLVMELLDGTTIDAVLRRRALAPREALEWTRQLCAGLDALHAAGIVHQDLKPQNVMVIQADSPTPIVKIVDFGLARLVAEPIETAAGTRRISGTPLYMAPEQARADDYVGPSADLFSLGVVTYEMLCGSVPFEVDHYTVPQVVLERATGQYRIRSVRAASQGRASSSQLDVLFGHALAAEPARRPKSASAFYEQMREALAA